MSDRTEQRMKLRALGVVTIVLALVVSLAGLAAADDSAQVQDATTSTTIAPGYEGFELFQPSDFATSLFDFVLFWGDQANVGPEYPPSPCVTDTTIDPSTTTTAVCLDVAGPNGQVNHGTFMSSFVHWLKSDAGQQALGDYSGPRGQLVKQAAKNDFGKGQWKKDKGIIGPTDGATTDLETTDTQDDGPNHAYGKSKHDN